MVKIITEPKALSPLGGNTTRYAIQIILESVEDFEIYLTALSNFEVEIALLPINGESEIFPTIILAYPDKDEVMNYACLMKALVTIEEGGVVPDFLYTIVDFGNLQQLFEVLELKGEDKTPQSRLWKFACWINQINPALEKIS